MSKNRLIKNTSTTTPGAPSRGVPFPGISPQSAYCVPVYGSQPVYELTYITVTDPNTGEQITIPHNVYKGFVDVLVGENCTPGTAGISWGVMGGVASSSVREQGGSVSTGNGGGNVVVTPPPPPPPTPSNPNPPRPPIVIQPPGWPPIIYVPPGGGGGDPGGPGTVDPDYPGGFRFVQHATPTPLAGTHAQTTITGPFLGYLYPGDPGLTPASVDYNIGWNAGAISLLTIPGDCIYTFTIPATVVAVITGLNTGENPGVAFAEIEHGIFVTGGVYQIVESDVGKSGSQPFASEDVFAIVRSGKTVTYWKNGVLVYNSAVPSIGPAFVDSSLMSGGDSIVDAHFTGVVPPEFFSSSGEIHGTLGPLVGAAGDLTITLAGVLGQLVGVASGDDDHVLNGILPGLTGTITSIGDGIGLASGILPGLVGNIGANGPVVQFAAVNGVLTNIVTVIRGLNGNAGPIYGILPGLTGFAADNDGAYCVGILATGMKGLSTDVLPPELGNAGFLRFPRMAMHAHGSSPVILGPDGQPRLGYGLYGNVPKMLLSGTGGGAGILRLPTLRLTATGTAITIAHLDALLPTPLLSITGVVTYPGRFNAKLPKLKLIGYGGGGSVGVGPDGKVHGALTFPKLRFVGATGDATGAGVLNKRLPRLRFVDGTGTKITTAELVAVLPMLRFVQAATLMLELPRLTMRATGKVTVAAEYEAYSFTLMPQTDGEIGTAATRITHYPFERIVRYMDRYYGVAIDGIYLLEGDDFAGEPIVACVQTGSEDYDRPNLKRLEALWFSGRCGADMNVAAISAEVEEPVYYMTPDKVGARAQRVEFGRGTEARYWAVRFTNVRGEDFQVENAASEITVLKRTHGGPS